MYYALLGGINHVIEGIMMRKFGPATPPDGIFVDEEWYLSRYPDVKDAIGSGKFTTARDHFYRCGYHEGRVPRNHLVDEKWYLQTYPDVAAAIKSGRVKSAYDHFMSNGYGEGRNGNENGI